MAADPKQQPRSSRLRGLVGMLGAITLHCVFLLLQRRPRHLRLLSWVAVHEPKPHTPHQLVARVAGSPLVPTVALGGFRLAAAAYIGGVGLLQLLRMRQHYGLPARAALLSFTVWTWWLLGLYFLLAGTVSLLHRVIYGPTPPVAPSAAYPPLPPAYSTKGPGSTTTKLPALEAAATSTTSGHCHSPQPPARPQDPVTRAVTQDKLSKRPSPAPTSTNAPSSPPRSPSTRAPHPPPPPSPSRRPPRPPHHPRLPTSPKPPRTPTLLPRKPLPRPHPHPPPPPALHALARAAHLIYHLVITAVPVVVLTTWTVLLPATYLLIPHPPTAAALRRMLFDFFSYNQHGGNLLLLATDAALNTLPFHPPTFPAVALYQLTYTALALSFFFASGGAWIYPFMPTRARWAPAAYLAMYAALWGFFTSAGLSLRLKDHAVARLLAARPTPASLRTATHTAATTALRRGTRLAARASSLAAAAGVRWVLPRGTPAICRAAATTAAAACGLLQPAAATLRLAAGAAAAATLGRLPLRAALAAMGSAAALPALLALGGLGTAAMAYALGIPASLLLAVHGTASHIAAASSAAMAATAAPPRALLHCAQGATGYTMAAFHAVITTTLALPTGLLRSMGLAARHAAAASATITIALLTAALAPPRAAVRLATAAAMALLSLLTLLPTTAATLVTRSFRRHPAATLPPTTTPTATTATTPPLSSTPSPPPAAPRIAGRLNPLAARPAGYPLRLHRPTPAAPPKAPVASVARLHHKAAALSAPPSLPTLLQSLLASAGQLTPAATAGLSTLLATLLPAARAALQLSPVSPSPTATTTSGQYCGGTGADGIEYYGGTTTGTMHSMGWTAQGRASGWFGAAPQGSLTPSGGGQQAAEGGVWGRLPGAQMALALVAGVALVKHSVQLLLAKTAPPAASGAEPAALERWPLGSALAGPWKPGGGGLAAGGSGGSGCRGRGRVQGGAQGTAAGGSMAAGLQAVAASGAGVPGGPPVILIP